MMTKMRSVLHCAHRSASRVSFEDEDGRKTLTIAAHDWHDMGEPLTITVTIRRGDLLND